MVTTRSTSRATSFAPEGSSPSSSSSSPTPFLHIPTRTTLLWMAISSLLVTWDFCYVFTRPHSLPGGALHFLWSPYALYGEVDRVYGVEAWEDGDGFTGAQGALNVVETGMYCVYMGAAWRGKGKIGGQGGKVVVLVGWAAAVMTLSKTVLYWANEIFSGFSNIGHNDFSTILTMWIIPNVLWLIFPTYMIITIGRDILTSMTGSPSPAKLE